jgi:transposase
VKSSHCYFQNKFTHAMNPIFARGDQRTRQKVLALRRQAQTDKAPRVALRLQAILLSLDRYSPPQIAQLLHADRSGVHHWVRNWNEHGMEGLKEGHRSGRPPLLTVAQMERLHDIVESGPVAHGLNTGVWTSPILAQVIHEEFGVEYHAAHVRRLLHKLGCSVQRPTTRLIRAKPAEQRKWIRYTYPNLKKKPKKKER